LTDKTIQVSHRADIHLRTGKKGRNPDVDGEPAFYSLDNRSLDGGILLTGQFHIIPNLDFGGFVSREDEVSILVPSIHENLDLISDIDRDIPFLVSQFLGRDVSLRLPTDVHHDGVRVDLHHFAVQYTAHLYGLQALFVQFLEADIFILFLRRSTGSSCRLLFADFIACILI